LKGLIIDEPWIGYILSGRKTWEMRSRNNAVRGRIALIRKGSSGVADLIGAVPKLSRSALKANVAKHQVPETEIDGEFKWNTAWVLEHARQLSKPVPYRHPLGAVTWVNLDQDVVATVEQQLPRR
jgi:hypothetical protein